MAMAQQFEGLDDDPETRSLIAASTVIEQCEDLLANGVSAFHFYTLNRAALDVCDLLASWRLAGRRKRNQCARRLNAK